MPNVTCVCPKCDRTFREEFSPTRLLIRCPDCSRNFDASDCFDNEKQLKQCVICQSPELFVRKDFPQRLGVTIVCIGFLASCIAWHNYNVWATFGILFGTAAIDLILFLSMGDLLECYRCHSQFRGFESLDEHQPFNLEVHEKHRQAAARKKSLSPKSNPAENAAPSTTS